MKSVRIYQPEIDKDAGIIALSLDASRHVAQVLKMQLGEHVTVFCGDNYEYASTITAITKKQVVVKIQQIDLVDRESPMNIHIAQAISKGDRMDWMIQKTVELGVTAITPIISARSVVRIDEQRLAKKIAHWQAIAIAACEQSGRNKIPLIYPAVMLENFVQHCPSVLKLILDPSAQHSWREYDYNTDITILIGPEGGFTIQELDAAKINNFAALSLGPRILRTETAAVVALSVFQAVGGDL